MKEYIPIILDDPRIVQVTSAWEPLRHVIKDIINRFNINQEKALEFGVERGYSTVVLANYFNTVIGVDPFNWIFSDGADRGFDAVKKLLIDWNNIKLKQMMSDQFIEENADARFDIIHIDIGYETHCYSTTFPSAKWAVQHSDCVLFHDIFSFPEINQVCEELSSEFGFDYYGYAEPIGPSGLICGLGILIKKI